MDAELYALMYGRDDIINPHKVRNAMDSYYAALGRSS